MNRIEPGSIAAQRPASIVETRRSARRLIPRLAAAALLIPAAPVIGLLALGVVVTMGRPVWFRQRRAGLGETTFTLLKLRSMREATDRFGAPLPDDERVTAFGRFLRRSRLDELPGLISVVRGHMAFVGPRPLLPGTIVELGARGVARGTVLPGLTGWAQVNGNTLLSLDEKIALDLWYAQHRSWRLDLRILVRTALVMLGGERRSQPAVPPSPVTH